MVPRWTGSVGNVPVSSQPSRNVTYLVHHERASSRWRRSSCVYLLDEQSHPVARMLAGDVPELASVINACLVRLRLKLE